MLRVTSLVGVLMMILKKNTKCGYCLAVPHLVIEDIFLKTHYTQNSHNTIRLRWGYQKR